MNTRSLHKFDHRYLFGTQFGEGIVSRAFCFYENPEFHEDGRGTERGLQILRRFEKHFTGKIYLLLTAQKLSFTRANLPKAAYDLFWKFDQLRNLEHIRLEVDIGNEIKLPIAVIDITDSTFDTNNTRLFDVARCACVLSSESIGTVASMVKPWILSYSSSKSMSISREAMINSLDKSDSHAFFLHLPSQNRWYETSAIAGPEEYVGIEITPAMEKALSGCSFSIL